MKLTQITSFVIVIMLAMLLAACSNAAEPDSVASAPTTVPETQPALATMAATWTPLPDIVQETPVPTEPPPATNTPLPANSPTPAATDTDTPTDTPTPEPTPTVEPTATAPPPTATSPPPTTAPVETAAATSPPPPPASPVPPAGPTAEPVLGVNLLPNPSFEEGHYNQNGIPELQLPNKWRLEWDEGPTGLGNESWDVYVRPEVRVLSTAFLPPEEHPLYIYNGQHTVKAFKGSGAVSFRLLTDVTLPPGTYIIEAKMFADIVQDWSNGQKIWAGDPSSAEFRFLVGDGGTVWTWQNFGQINVHNWTFTVDQLKTITVGIALRGKYAISNNGWFIDDLSLRQIE